MIRYKPVLTIETQHIEADGTIIKHERQYADGRKEDLMEGKSGNNN